MLKILIVDDEPLARDRLASLLTELQVTHEVFEASNGMMALERIAEHHPDIVLLDIRMPVMDGLEVAHHLTGRDDPPAIIFTTAYQDHALDAFNTHAVDYLLKPVRQERLGEALERASILKRATIADVRKQDKSAGSRSHLSASFKGDLILVPVDAIRYLRAEQKYVIAGWPDGELLLDETLVSLEEELAEDFVRIHRNALVANRYIDALVKDSDGSYLVSMSGVNKQLQVSRRNLGYLRKQLRNRQN